VTLEVRVGVVERDPHRPARKRGPPAASRDDVLRPDCHPAARSKQPELLAQAVRADRVASHRGMGSIDDSVVEQDWEHGREVPTADPASATLPSQR